MALVTGLAVPRRPERLLVGAKAYLSVPESVVLGPHSECDRCGLVVRAGATNGPAGLRPKHGVHVHLRCEAVLPRDDLLRGGAVLPPTLRPESGRRRWGWRAVELQCR